MDSSDVPLVERALGLRVCQLCAVDFSLKHFLLPLIGHMRDRGWEVTAVCSLGSQVGRLRAMGYRIDTIEIPRSKNPLRLLCSVYRLTRYLKANHFDVVHTHTPIASLVGRIAAWLSGVPTIVTTIHGFYFHDQMGRIERSLHIAIERLLARFNQLMFSQSEEDTNTALRLGIASKTQIVTIGNGVDPRLFSPMGGSEASSFREALGIPQAAYLVGYIGRLVVGKGLIELLDAIQTVAEHHPNVWVMLVGEYRRDEHEADVSREIHKAKQRLGQRLVVLGHRDDVASCLNAMDLFCLPSWREGMPRSIIEAMMMAKPVLATDIRGSREEVIHEETGLLVPLKSPRDLAEAITRLVDDPEWGKTMGMAGRQRALRIFDEREIVKLQADKVYAECVRGRESSRERDQA